MMHEITMRPIITTVVTNVLHMPDVVPHIPKKSTRRGRRQALPIPRLAICTMKSSQVPKTPFMNATSSKHPPAPLLSGF